MLFERKNNGMFSLKENQEIEEYFIPLSVVKEGLGEACRLTSNDVDIDHKKGPDKKTISRSWECGPLDEDEDGQELDLELEDGVGPEEHMEQVLLLAQEVIEGLGEDNNSEDLFTFKQRLAALAGLADAKAREEPKSHFDRDKYNNQHNEKHREVFEKKKHMKGQTRGLPPTRKLKQ